MRMTKIAPLLTIVFTDNLFYGMASPFLPRLYREEREIEMVWIGLIFSCFAIGSTISAIVTGKIVDKTGHRIFLLLGVILDSTATICFGLLYGTDSEATIISISIILRLV